MHIDIPLVNGCFALELQASYKMVLLSMAVKSFEGEYRYSPSLFTLAGCKESTVLKGITELISRSFVRRERRGLYCLSVPKAPTQKWVNLELFGAVMGMSLPFNEKLVLLAIVKHTSVAGACYPKIKTLSTLSGISDRSITRTIKKLEDRGLLIHANNDGRWEFTHKFDTTQPVHLSGIPVNLSGLPVHLSPHNKEERLKKGIEEGGQAPKGSTFLAEGIGMKKARPVRMSGTVASMVEKLKNKPLKPVAEGHKGLITIWRAGIAAHFDNPMHHTNLTAKDVAQLKYVGKVLKEAGANPGEVLGRITGDWMGFVSFVTAQEGLKHWPNMPTLGWLVKYVNHAYTWFTIGDGEADLLQLIASKGKIATSKPSTDDQPEEDGEDWSVEGMMKKFKVGDHYDS